MIVRYLPGGQLEDLPEPRARELLAAGVVEQAGGWPDETAMLAPVETAMLPAPAAKTVRKARSRKRG